MRRIILGSALAICALLPAFSQTTCPATVFTPNLNLSLPALGTKNWNLCLNPNFQVIDAAIARLQNPFLGPWSASTVYTKGAFVSFNNAIYISSIFSNINNTPAAGSTAWQLFFSIGGGGGGSCGPVSGDPTSTNCGTGNSVGATYTGPPSLVQTYGDNLNGGASGQDGVVIGHDSGINASLDQTVVIGDFDYANNDPTAGMSGFESVFIGSANAAYFGGSGSGVGGSFSDSLGVGARNYQQFNGSAHPFFSTVVALGFQNVSNQNVNVVPNNYRDVVGIGDASADSTHSLQDVVAIGDSALSGGNSAPGPSYSDVIAIGDVAASLPPDGSSTLIAIGLCPMCIGDVNAVTGALSESIAIGDEAIDSGVNTHDLIGIGDEAMFGPESGPCLSATPAFGGGSGYTDGDVITVVSSGASGCQFSVTTSGGAVTALTLVSGGDGYPTSRNNLSTTGGTGSGLFVNIQSNAYTTGNDDIAIGNFAGAAFRAGSENIALGTNACAVNYGSGPTRNGNSTTDGNEDICIGDNAGQSVSTPLNDIIVIGHQAQARMSNQIVMGDDSNNGVFIGNSTSQSNTGFDVVAIGPTNARNNIGGPLVAIGDDTGSYLFGASTTQLNNAVGIGDHTLENWASCTDCIGLGDFTLQASNGSNPSVSDIIAIGNVAGEFDNTGADADIYIGLSAGDITAAGVGAPTETIGIGTNAADNSIGADDIAIGDGALNGQRGSGNQNTGNDNIAIGLLALAANQTGSENTAIGTNAGCVSCSGGSNGANFNATGSHNVWIGDLAGPSVPSTTEIDSSIAIGFQSQNVASNEARFGSQTATFDTYLFGTIHTASATVPTASAGTLVGTNNGGAISGLSAATSVTVTFAGGAGFRVWNSCTANASAASTPVAVSALSLTSVTFSFPSLTGSLYFHCDGN